MKCFSCFIILFLLIHCCAVAAPQQTAGESFEDDGHSTGEETRVDATENRKEDDGAQAKSSQDTWSDTFKTMEDFYTGYGEAARVGPVRILPSTLQVSLTVGEDYKITTEVLPEEEAEAKLSWSASAAPIVGLSPSDDGESCIVHGKRAGAATVRVEAENGAYAVVKVTVKEVEPQRLLLDYDADKIMAGEAALIRAKVEPQQAGEDAKVVWSVIDPDGCAAVSYGENLCRIKGLDEGSVHVTAQTEDGRAVADVEVFVEKPGLQQDPQKLWTLLIRWMVYCALGLMVLAAGIWFARKLRKG